jgi:hypothetical protein
VVAARWSCRVVERVAQVFERVGLLLETEFAQPSACADTLRVADGALYARERALEVGVLDF